MGHHSDDPRECGPSQVLSIYTPCRSSLRYVWDYTFFIDQQQLIWSKVLTTEPQKQ